MQKHAAKFNAFQGLLHKDKIAEPEKVCLLNKIFSRSYNIVKASYGVAYLTAKKSKPFTHGEFIKQCIESVADIICPEKRGYF